MYEYKAYVTKVYDGDTITVDIDLGLGVWLRKQSIRLAGINAPEVRGDSKYLGYASRDALSELILDKEVKIKTYKSKRGKYGRWIVDVHKGPIFVNEWLLEEGFAEVYMPM